MSGEPAMPRKLLFVVNVDWFFVSHRLAIATAAIAAGYEVHLAATFTDKRDEIEAHGIIAHPLAIRRGGANPWSELQNLMRVFGLVRSLSPDVLHLVTIKPIIMGGLSARLLATRAVVMSVSGLGFVFSSNARFAAAVRPLVLWLYRACFNREKLRVIFQNRTDQDTICAATGLPIRKCVLIRGSGVDLDRFAPAPRAASKPIVVLAARLLKDKGIAEFVEAAKALRSRGVEARMCLVGEPDPESRASIEPAQLGSWRAEGAVELWGHRQDMPAVLQQASIAVLPSYYGEGVPKVLLEAAACGCAVVTTDMPGCRDAITPGKTGLVVAPRDAEGLANAIERLLAEPALCNSMGRAGRTLAQAEFGIGSVVATHLQIYAELLGPP
ncbi:glycosyltransferase involved in cell wall biosynthesis [Pseudorhodoferax soli]|uniref:Glycosyltransferase involved in cell wall biosynthesis n=2 Tax=Pseudorhodoferax soli TaxID=545864 RepID=A0A368Y508_9BURK|nr:glycosyltransferase involved in cell wall biosynthesis [Pseudorhodoferax soli]